ncbi:MAG: integration host factor subunit beta [Deltaproteobacteria bacterium]|nr:integration host factor subunit beta [Deltaproteobacteria bacterium]MBW2052239.1 integration host factor subunit beta [Deltaproteobacteria bacterium]MBW2141691.1 integration host factor subunit beta [Deltaproteobacteria bacterium]MBW2322054.1 integration host factor subunit beta [Deltaproteobacteria bacterium]
MVKRELIAALAREHKDLKARDIEYMVSLIFEAATRALVQGEKIELRGFGSFHIREYAPREARNPGTGETVNLGHRRSVLFKAGKDIKKRLNDN